MNSTSESPISIIYLKNTKGQITKGLYDNNNDGKTDKISIFEYDNGK